MNKEIMLSIQPKHLVNILNGNKTLELRKSIPKDFKGWVNLYCTKGGGNLVWGSPLPYYVDESYVLTYGYSTKDADDIFGILNGKVVARFWFDEYEEIKERFNGDEYIIEKLDELCLSDYEVKEYLGNKKGYAWHIKQLEIFDEPLELSDFIVGLNYLGDIIPPTYKKLKKAPQSYQFVYRKGE